MSKLSIDTDAFSHGQIKSKIWLMHYFNECTKKHLSSSHSEPFDIHWYGSWVGVGPFLMLLKSAFKIRSIDLYDLNSEDLQTSMRLLEYWHIEHGIDFRTHAGDINHITYEVTKDTPLKNQIIINTSCEHVIETDWLIKLPNAAHVFFQSTDMELPEHVNCPKSLEDFKEKYSPYINILDTNVLNVKYTNKSFNRYMLFGQKK